jgi:hypothetical protein
VNNLELRSRLYAWLGDRTSQPDGNVHDHESLLTASRDLAEVVQAIATERAAEVLEAAADDLTYRVRTWVLNDLRDRAAALRTAPDDRAALGGETP